MTAAQEGVPLAERTVAELLAAVASREPAPGGGAAAGVAVALAAGLSGMTARSSDGELEDARVLADRADGLRAEGARLAQADVEAYGDFLAASRREDEDARLATLSRATDVPLAIAEVGATVAELAARLYQDGNPTLRGDAGVGVALAEAGTRAAATLVQLNSRVGGFGDDRARRAEDLADRAAAARARVERAR